MPGCFAMKFIDCLSRWWFPCPLALLAVASILCWDDGERFAADQPPRKDDEQRRALTRSILASHIVDELAAGRVDVDEASKQFFELMAMEPSLLEHVRRVQGLSDGLAACRRLVITTAEERRAAELSDW